MNHWLRHALAGAIAALAAGPSFGQSAPALLPPAQDPLAARLAGVAPPEPPAPEAAPPAPDGTTFALNGIVLDGATALGPDALAPLWRDLVGRQVSLTELEALAEAITARYRDAGFVLAQALVPAQDVVDGVVRIAVIEGFIENVRIEGGSPAAARATARRFERAAASRPLALAHLERAVLLSRDTLGGGVETVLAPSAETFGAADLTVLIAPRPVAGFASLDTRGSRRLGDVTASAGLTLRGVLGAAERLDLLASGDPLGGRIGYLRGDAALPLFALDGTRLDGAALGLRGEFSRAEPGLAIPGFRVVTDEAVAAAALAVPLLRTRPRNAAGRIGLEWRRSEAETTFGGAVSRVTDRLLVLEVGASFDAADRRGGVTLMDIALRQGLDIGGTGVGDVGPAAGSPSFTRAFGRIARLQRLGPNLSLFAEGIGQTAGGVLPGPERFSLGSGSIGRGFAPGNTTGDDGFGLRLELRRQIALPGEAGAAELYGFGDWGRARDRSLARDGRRWENVASAGIGARIDIGRWLTLTPEIVRRLDGEPSDGDGTGGETRFHIGAIARF